MLKGENLYALLGLEETSFESTEKEIRNAYHKAALTYHPDKIGKNATSKDKKIWLKIQGAYDRLSDPE